MSKADKMLLECGYVNVESVFEDWFVFFDEEIGNLITFRNDVRSVHSSHEINFFDFKFIDAIHKKAEELGWFDVYDGSSLMDEIEEHDIDIETISGMSWEELYGEN